MNKQLVLSSCAAALLSTMVAAAQTATQTPTQSPVQGSTQGITGQAPTRAGTQAGAQVTVTGCVVRESEYTKARGGVLGTGVGAGNEFVLANAMSGRSAPAGAQIASGVSGSTSAASGSGATGTSGTATGSAGATAGATSPGAATRGGLTYTLTGNREGDLAQHVGKRVEIVGTIDSSIRPSITAAPQGEPAASLQELTIVSFRPAEGNCQ